MVSLSREQGSATINETETAKRDSLLSDARADPDVAAILSKFPGAKIINVRIATPAGQADGEISSGAAPGDDTLAASRRRRLNNRSFPCVTLWA